MKLSTVERAMQHLRHAEELLAQSRTYDHFPSTCEKPLARALIYTESAREVVETLAGWVENESSPELVWEISFSDSKTRRLYIKGRYWWLRDTAGHIVDNKFGIADYDDTTLHHALAALQSEYGEYMLKFIGDEK